MRLPRDLIEQGVLRRFSRSLGFSPAREIAPNCFGIRLPRAAAIELERFALRPQMSRALLGNTVLIPRRKSHVKLKFTHHKHALLGQQTAKMAERRDSNGAENC
jgi:hypothetical protein